MEGQLYNFNNFISAQVILRYLCSYTVLAEVLININILMGEKGFLKLPF